MNGAFPIYTDYETSLVCVYSDIEVLQWTKDEIPSPC